MKRRRHLLYWIGGWIFDFTKIITILTFFGLFVNYFIYTVLIVKGESMEPNYWDGDVMIVDRIRYRVTPPERDDVIALYFPGELDKKFIKRIIGLPNEEITIKDGNLYINQALIQEPYLPALTTRPDMDLKLGADEYFVMGDNRDLSSDSRIWGPLPAESILGVVEYKVMNTKSWQNKVKQVVIKSPLALLAGLGNERDV